MLPLPDRSMLHFLTEVSVLHLPDIIRLPFPDINAYAVFSPTEVSMLPLTDRSEYAASTRLKRVYILFFPDRGEYAVFTGLKRVYCLFPDTGEYAAFT